MKKLVFTMCIAMFMGSVANADLLAPQSIDFQEVEQDTTVSQTITIFNGALEDLTNVTVKLNGAPFWFDVGACNGLIEKNDSCALEVRFTPTRNGRFNGHIVVSGDDSQGGDSVSIRVTGRAAQ